MRGAMETVQDLIEEAKVRAVCWAICIFAITYFLSHTSKSMWMNLPITILILCALRYLSYEVELRWRVKPIPKETYLSHLEKKQLSVNDSRLSGVLYTSNIRNKIDSPLVEAAINDFIKKILQDFVVDLWYSSITPDKEVPELIHLLILDALGEISGRLKEINLIDFLTRMVDLIGDHLDLYRNCQSEIGVDVMSTLSLEERDERLKHHLIASKKLHPALISSECEYKVLQRIAGGILAVVLKPRDANSPLVRGFSREFLASLVIQPLMNFASPGYINELIEYIFLASQNNKSGDVGVESFIYGSGSVRQHSVSSKDAWNGESDPSRTTTSKQSNDSRSDKISELGASVYTGIKTIGEDSPHHNQCHSAEWAMILEAATKRRSQVLAPENLENLWTKGRNYQKKTTRITKEGTSKVVKMSGTASTSAYGGSGKETLINMNAPAGVEDKHIVHSMHMPNCSTHSSHLIDSRTHKSNDLITGNIQEGHFGFGSDKNSKIIANSNNLQLKRSSSTPDINRKVSSKSIDASNPQESCTSSEHREESSAALLPYHDGSSYPKLKCRVVGAYFEELGSKTFAVYSIAVRDAENKTWFVKRRYRNFERLHRYLKDIPNYKLQLPPKRLLSSSIDDYFVHKRCILLDKYLQDLLSIANIAEQHEVWDFLSESSKNYSFGKSTSVMKTLAVNVDDAMDDIVRQVKGVSDGFRRKIVGTSTLHVTSPPIVQRAMTLSWNGEDKNSPSSCNMGTSQSLSDEDIQNDDHSSICINGWHSDNELNSKGFPPRVVKHKKESVRYVSHKSQQLDKFGSTNFDNILSTRTSLGSDAFEGLPGVPPEWAPANVSVPMLNLVDKVFQLNRRGWLRRQVFWISKQILQLMMEDAIDDWILRQIHWLRSEEVIAQAIRWVQDVLWPDGTFFIKLGSSEGKLDDINFNHKPSHITRRGSSDKSSFELQLEAARRASDVKKMIFEGAPTAVVSLIGHKQYRRSARDIYFFLQSTVCLKQLAYNMLEVALVSLFPELKDLIRDIHEKTHAKSA